MSQNRRILEPVLQTLDPDRSRYFAEAAEAIDKDPRLEDTRNLAFLVLSRTARDLPTELPKGEFVDRLVSFVGRAGPALARRIYSREFPTHPQVLDEVTNRFLAEIVEAVFERLQDGIIQPTERRILSYSFPRDANEIEAFPFNDDDEMEEA
jgi:hypothetical protein